MGYFSFSFFFVFVIGGACFLLMGCTEPNQYLPKDGFLPKDYKSQNSLCDQQKEKDNLQKQHDDLFKKANKIAKQQDEAWAN